jgi:hypothetical protein
MRTVRGAGDVFGRRKIQYRWALMMGTLCTVLLACGSDTSGPTSPTQTYWALRLNYHAVNMATIAPYDTLQLHAIAYTPDGEVLPDSGVTTYQVKDSSVSVSPTGFITANFRTKDGKPTWVIASRQYQNVTLADTVLIQITDTIPQHAITTFSMQPPLGDSAKRAIGTADNQLQWGAEITDDAGTTICDHTKCKLLVNYTSSNPAISEILESTKNGTIGGHMTLHHAGHVTFVASTWAYGVARRDSIVFTVGYRTAVDVPIGFNASDNVVYCSTGFVCGGNHSFGTMVLTTGGVASFWCYTYTFLGVQYGCKQPVDIVFDHPDLVDTASTALVASPPTGSGNIAAFQSSTSLADAVRSRRFTQPGVYHFYSTAFPSDTGTIRVIEDPQ